MDRLTILKATGCDVRRLPLGAREAFFLSQLDGKLTLEELSEIAGLDIAEVTRVAKQLLEHGAVSVLDEPPPTSRRPNARAPAGAIAEESRTRRADPRAETDSPRPSPASTQPVRRPTPKPERRRSRKSLRMLRAASPSPAPSVADETCELDEATLTAIAALDAKLATHDHYALLGVERGAEKKAIKRAYFGYAAKFHPDRFFGKKLGRARAPIERIFRRLTEAHDTLTSAPQREAYDATLPPPPAAQSAPIPPKPARKSSKGMRAVSRKMQAVRPSSRKMQAAKPATAPPAEVPIKPASAPPVERQASKPASAPPVERQAVKPASAPPAERLAVTPTSAPPTHTPSTKPRSLAPQALGSRPPVVPVVGTEPPPDSKDPANAQTSDERARRLRTAAMELKVQANVDNLVKAADDALKANDIVGAGNNLRLALSHREDAAIRRRLEELDSRSRILRFEKNILPARAAERDQRWADAAILFTRAYEARPDADVAWRAANALHKSGGDLKRSAVLGEHAVSLDPKNLAYRLTLGEIYLAADRLTRAEEVAEEARELAPKDARVKDLATAIAARAKAAAKQR